MVLCIDTWLNNNNNIIIKTIIAKSELSTHQLNAIKLGPHCMVQKICLDSALLDYEIDKLSIAHCKIWKLPSNPMTCSY